MVAIQTLILRVVLVGAALLPYTPPVMAKPVVMELFVLGIGCSTCAHALNAVPVIRDDFSTQEAHILVYDLDDPDLPFPALARARFYNITPNSTLPVAVFDGRSRITGAAPGIASTYRQNIRNRLDIPVEQLLEGETTIAGRDIIFGVTAELTRPASGFRFVWGMTEDRVNEVPARLFDFRTEGLRVFQEFTVTIPEPIRVDDVRAIFMLQDSNSDEIVSSLSLPQPDPIIFDLDNDKDINKIDLFLLAEQWRRTNQPADFNRDGFVNAFDLILFWGVWSIR